MVKVALLENINPQAVSILNGQGWTEIETHAGALEGEALKKILSSANVLGIRSKTQLTRELLASAPHLTAIGCFCIGTDQVDLKAAQEQGIAVFNAPYANTRSVAELVLGEIIMLMRKIPQKDKAAHAGEWLKAVDGACEVRGKVLGIVGYGHIGTQLSILAEAIGMQVVFFDIVNKLSLGNAQKCNSLEELLAQADVVTLHVPATPQTANMVKASQLEKMKKGAFLVNASRGNIVDINALKDALVSEHLAGAAIDVFPVEPYAKGEVLETPLRNLPNVILTPHIGGSTIEAQENIALDVAEKLTRYVDHGITLGAVNMPQVALPEVTGHTRFRHWHRNEPGVLAKINDVFSSRSLNIAAQYLQTNAQTGYVVIDVDGEVKRDEIVRDLQAITGTVRAF